MNPTMLDPRMWGPFHDIPDTKDAIPPTIEGRLQAVEDKQAIADLNNAYTYYYDSGSVDRLMSVFADDCVVVNPRGTYAGTRKITENYEYLVSTRRFSFHNASNVMVKLLSPNEAVMTSYLTGTILMKSGNMNATVGTYADRLAKRNGRWLFVERRITSNCRYFLAAIPTVDLPGTAPLPSTNEGTRDWLGREFLL